MMYVVHIYRDREEEENDKEMWQILIISEFG